jgi:hypothetical protein
MSYSFEGDEIPTRNEEWIKANYIRTLEWLEENYHMFGNSKADMSKPEIFYTVNPEYLTLALRYPKEIAKGNVAESLSFNFPRLEFKTNLEKCLIDLLDLKHAKKPIGRDIIDIPTNDSA